MDQTAQVLAAAHELYVRDTVDPNTVSRPPVYKAIGICLAVASGCFIGVSFVLKKVGLLKANEKYNEVAGEGYGYLKNAFWWTGMTLMIIGEICNFVAYAFVDAILVTPLGALSVVITTILSAIFLKERLSLVGKVGCFLCIIGSVIILMNAPAESSAATIQQMQGYVIAPGFLSYAGVIIIICIFIALWAGPRYGKKSMLVYLSICSLIGGLSVVATQGLGAAVVAQAGGIPQFNQWFLYVLFVFVVTTLVTEIIFLNKALNLFNAALVTPTYYVFFTSSTIVTSAILFRGFHGTVTGIVTVVLGFFVICAGVILLQLSKSAKDVPDAAVFSGDLDQVRTIAEQEQPESEPKADAIRGAAAIVRRISVARQKMEANELKRLHEEKQRDLEPIGEDEHVEWDGLRRRRTTIGSVSSRRMTTPRLPTPQHPPLGMSHFPTEEELSEPEDRPDSGGLGSSLLGTIRHRARSIVSPGNQFGGDHGVQSPMHPVPLTEISVPGYKNGEPSPYGRAEGSEHFYGLPPGLRHPKTEYEGAGGDHVHFQDNTSNRSESRGSAAPPPPPHSARRQFSFHNVFRKSQAPPPDEPLPSRAPAPRIGLGSRSGSHTSAAQKGATEEERLGLVKGDTSTSLPHYEEEDDDVDENWETEKKRRSSPPNSSRESPSRPSVGRVVAGASPPQGSPHRREQDKNEEAEAEHYEHQKHKWKEQQWDEPRGPPPPFDDGKGGGGGAFI